MKTVNFHFYHAYYTTVNRYMYSDFDAALPLNNYIHFIRKSIDLTLYKRGMYFQHILVFYRVFIAKKHYLPFDICH